MQTSIKIAISIGDINGIGPEVLLKSLSNKDILEFFTPVIFGSIKVLNFHAKQFSEQRFQLNGIRNAEDAVDGKINVVNLWRDLPEMELGTKTETAGKHAFESLEAAAKAVKERHCQALVTAPINKENIQSESFNFPGHTEYLGSIWEGRSRMLMLSEDLNVAMVTQHVPLQDIPKHITQEAINSVINDVNSILKQDFGILKPKIAVLGLNPHAGDGGLLGKEEHEVIAPSIKSAMEKGIYCFGPYSADSFFSPEKLSGFDIVVAMYHDQALIPFKTLSFGNGVNFTANLPFVRTSPDHGVAYDLAGKGEANEQSFREALFSAREIYALRTDNQELLSNRLKISKREPRRYTNKPRKKS